MSSSVTHVDIIGRVNPSDLGESGVGRQYVVISCDKYILLLIFIGICICAEQTFIEASAKDKRFPEAFSIALSIYMRSAIKEDVKREICILLEGKDIMDRSHYQPLEDIIKNHRLRTCLAPDLAACLTMKR